METVLTIKFYDEFLYCKIDGDIEEFLIDGIYLEDPNDYSDVKDYYNYYTDKQIDKILDLLTAAIESSDLS